MPPFLENMYLCNMKEELTTLMHSEFIGREIPIDDLLVMSVWAQVNRKGIALETACADCGISVKQYQDNVERVMN